MTVRRNMSFGLRMRGTRREDRDRRVAEVAAALGMEQLLDRRPAALSGGQRQRVAMGRAIVREPQVFLMDEPLSNLDAKLRVSMRAQLTLLHQRLGVTTIYVTHDQIEAMTLGQRVAVLRDGALQQCDTPQNLFRHPVNLFVAAFIGSPAMNFIRGHVIAGKIRFADHILPLPAASPLAACHRDVIVGIRPTAFAPGGTDGWAGITVTPSVIEDLGDERYVVFDLAAPPVDTDALQDAHGGTSPADVALLSGAGGHARWTVRLPADMSRLYFFDPDTGAAIG
jgi:multiple sugar transport system ATP-binding protein